MTEALSHRSVSVCVQVRYEAGSCEIFGEQSCIEPGFSPSTSVSVVSTFTPTHHTHLNVHFAHIRRKN
jgi:hypothetical protein